MCTLKPYGIFKVKIALTNIALLRIVQLFLIYWNFGSLHCPLFCAEHFSLKDPAFLGYKTCNVPAVLGWETVLSHCGMIQHSAIVSASFWRLEADFCFGKIILSS